MHPLWTELATKENKKFYYNSITGVLTLQRFTVEEGEFSDSIPGGKNLIIILKIYNKKKLIKILIKL